MSIQLKFDIKKRNEKKKIMILRRINKNNHNTVTICTNLLYYMLNGLKDAINLI